MGLDGQPTQTIPTFVLPGLSSGAILLNTNLSDFGQRTVTVKVQSLTQAAINASSQAQVSPAVVGGPIIAGPAAPITGYEFTALANVPLATFTQGNGSQAPGKFQVTINWGDGTALDTTTGQVTESGDVYTITGSHTYDDESYPPGRFVVSIPVTDGTNMATLHTTATILEQLLANGTRGTPNERFINEVYRDLARLLSIGRQGNPFKEN
jgi:hypothetical protein